MNGSGGVGQKSLAQAPSTIPADLLRRQHRRNVAFSVLVAVALLLGAAVMGMVLAGAGAPDAIVLGVVLAALPVGPIVACYLWLDRYEPEPLRLLLLAFGWGAVAATGAALLLQVAGASLEQSTELWSAAVVAPVTEEAGKGLFVVLLLWARRHEIAGVLDGLVYAGLVGVGFAFTENILYFAAAYMGGSGLGSGGLGAATTLFVMRGIFSPFAHPLFTSAIGIGVGLAVTARTRRTRFAAPALGYAVAVALHAGWNGSAFLGDGSLFLLTFVLAMVPAFLGVLGLAVWVRGRERTMLTRALTDVARHGLVGAHELPWLVDLPARTAARRFARNFSGPVAERAVREYQQQAVELAFLHDRYLRGSAPPDFAARGTEMARRLSALRPWVLFPPGGPPRHLWEHTPAGTAPGRTVGGGR